MNIIKFYILALTCCLISIDLYSQESLNIPYPGYGYEWENNNLGIDRKVPLPWTLVQVNERTLSVWGRTFSFGNALFPEQITSQGNELLSRRMNLALRINGESYQDNSGGAVITDQGNFDRVELEGKISGKSADVIVKTSLEFDGFLRFDITIDPKVKPVVIEEMIFEIPYSSSVATYYTRFYDYDFANERVNRTDMINSAGKIKGTMLLPFNHHVWIGNHKAGAELSIETNYHWSEKDVNKAIEIEPDQNAFAVNLRANIITLAKKITESVTFSFGLMVTPIKPLTKNWRSYILGNGVESADGYDSELWTKSTAAVRIKPEFISHFTPPVEPELFQKYNDVRKELQDKNTKFIPYAALMFMHKDMPELKDYAKYWLTDLKASQNPRILWTNVNFYSKSIQDFYIWHYVRSIKEWQQDGLYFDGGANPFPVKNSNTEYDISDKSGKSYIPIFSVREFHKRLYKAVKSHNAEFLITQHSGSAPKMFCGFSDFIYTGESMNLEFIRLGAEAYNSGNLPEGWPPYLPDYSNFPDDYWQAIYTQSFGFVNVILPMVAKWRDTWAKPFPELPVAKSVESWMKNTPGYTDKFTRMLLSRTIPLDIPLWRSRFDSGIFDNLMHGYQKYFGGLIEPLNFIGHYEAEKINLNFDKSNLIISVYIRPEQGKMVLLVANWTNEAIEEKVKLNFKDLNAGLHRIIKVTDIEDESHKYAYSEDAITVKIPANDFRVIMIH